MCLTGIHSKCVGLKMDRRRVDELDCRLPGNLSEVIASHVRDVDTIMASQKDLSPAAQKMASDYITSKLKTVKQLEKEYA